LAFVVPQVDDDGYVLSPVYVEAIKNLYTEDTLKALVRRVAPGCIDKANARAKGKYKAQQI